MAARTVYSDEQLARKLQTQFDEEYAENEEIKKKDLAMARAISKAHTMSDSDDSEPDNIRLRTGSEDLFADSDDDNGTGSHSKVKRSHTSSTKKKKVLEETGPYDADTDVEDDPHRESNSKTTLTSNNKKPSCKYGRKCYRKNPSHVEEFHHPAKRKIDGIGNVACSPEKKAKTQNNKSTGVKSAMDIVEEFQPFSFFLTKVKDADSHYNSIGALSLKDSGGVTLADFERENLLLGDEVEVARDNIDIVKNEDEIKRKDERDILSESVGKLKASCHFNFMFDMDWLVKQYSDSARQLPLLLVHGEQGRDELNMKAEAQHFSHISLCRAPLEIPYGTHHTKMMFLLYTTGLRIVIHTANLIPNDWHQKTQGIWVSPLFPPLIDSSEKGDSPTGFKTDLLQYVAAYRLAKLAPWERHIQAHNMTAANVHIIGSVPGRHTLSHKHSWGHLKLKKVLSERGPDPTRVRNWPLVGQFSSIGSLGPDKNAWLMSEWARSLSSCKGSSMMQGIGVSQAKVDLIFPSKDNIRLSLEGYNGGGCVPYSIKTASKQPWLTPFFSQWKSEGRGRSKAVPHIKSYTRHSPDGTEAAWFIVTSANLSKAAWGVLEKKGSQLMIRSYELGVLFLPQYFGYKTSFPVSSKVEDIIGAEKATFPLPYDLPPTTYIRGDRPWFIDVPCVDLPDTFGLNWCPPL